MATFFENLRQYTNNLALQKGEKPTFVKSDPIAQRRWEQVDFEGLDKWAQSRASKTPQQIGDDIEQKGRDSSRGTLFLNNIKNNSSSFDIDPQTDFFSNLQIAQNMDKLNKIVTDYEKVNGWDKKQQVIQNGYNSFKNKTPKLTQWFDNFARLTTKAADPKDSFNDSPKEIADAMRYYLTSAHDKYFKEV